MSRERFKKYAQHAKCEIRANIFANELTQGYAVEQVKVFPSRGGK